MKILIYGSFEKYQENAVFLNAICEKNQDIKFEISFTNKMISTNRIDFFKVIEEPNLDIYDYLIDLDSEIKTNENNKSIFSKIDHRLEVIAQKKKEEKSRLTQEQWLNLNSKILELQAKENNYTEKKDKRISLNVMKLPGFELSSYLSIRKNGVSILANNCWAGLAYHRLGLEIQSPFINMWIYIDEYMDMLRNFDSVLDEHLEIIGAEFSNERSAYYPIMKIGDTRLYWNHCFTEEQILDDIMKWERRKNRIIRDRVLLMAYFPQPGQAKIHANEFNNFEFRGKVGLSYELQDNNIHLMNEFISLREKTNCTFAEYVIDTVQNNPSQIMPFNLFKLLNFEEGYMRY